jgi:hypothetical protein
MTRLGTHMMHNEGEFGVFAKLMNIITTIKHVEIKEYDDDLKVTKITKQQREMERKGFLESSKMTINKEGVLKRAR